jgi:hypothetical protein
MVSRLPELSPSLYLIRKPSAFKSLHPFPTLTVLAVGGAIQMLSGPQVNPDSVSFDTPVLVGYRNRDIGLTTASQLAIAMQSSFSQYQAVQATNGICGAHSLMLNVVFWETIANEVALSQLPDHPMHQFRLQVEHHFWGKSSRNVRKLQGAALLVHWSDIGGSASISPCSIPDLTFPGPCFTTRDLIRSSKWHLEDLSASDRMILIIAEFYRMPMDFRWRAILTRAVIDRLGVEVLLLDSVSAFLHQPPSSTLGVYTKPSVSFVRAMSQIRVDEHCMDMPVLTPHLLLLRKTVEAQFSGLSPLLSMVSDPPPGHPEPPAISTPDLYSPAIFLSRIEDLCESPEAAIIQRHPTLRHLALILYLSLPFLDTLDFATVSARDPAHRLLGLGVRVRG